MPNRLLTLTLGVSAALTVLTASTLAQFPQAQPSSTAPSSRSDRDKAYAVHVDSAGGTVSGSLRLPSVVLQNELGRYELKPDRIREIRFEPPATEKQSPPMFEPPLTMVVPAHVVTRAGDDLRGNVLVQSWQLETDLGTLTLNPLGLRVLSFHIPGTTKSEAEEKEKPREKAKGKEGDSSHKNGASKPRA